MFTYTIQHNHCGMITKIQGENVYDAFKKNGKDLRVWAVIKYEINF